MVQMATHGGRLTQDQNFNVHFDGHFVGDKTNGSKPQKKGMGLSGRRALDVISNSGKPSALQPSRKHNSINVIAIGEELGASKTTFGGKTAFKTSEKGQVGGRKALRDLTNSGKPSGQPVLKKKSQSQSQRQDKKSITVAEDFEVPKAIAEERFLHNHQDCIKAQTKSLNWSYFLKTIGLNDDTWSPPLALPPSDESPVKLFKMEELLEMITEDESHGQDSPVFGSPKPPYMHFLKEYDFPNFVLMESPTRSKY